MEKDSERTPIMTLSERHVVNVLIGILDAGRRVKLSELYEFAKYKTINPLTERMAREGLITKTLDRETYVATFLELTPKGRAVAEKLKEAVDIFEDRAVKL
jgi:DNA-binding MarR family transcriptional regulator